MRKKLTSLGLALCMAVTMVSAAAAAPAVQVEQIPASGTAYAAEQTVTIDGKPVTFQMYALRDAGGNGTNYIKLRDLAYALNGTPAQFAVEYDGSIQVVPGRAYTPAGGEMTTPFTGDRSYTGGAMGLRVAGDAVDLTAFTLLDDQGGGYTYFKLRDLGAVLGFGVDWDDAAKRVTLDTGSGSSSSASQQNISDAELLDLAKDLLDRAASMGGDLLHVEFAGLDYNDTATVASDHWFGPEGTGTGYRVIGCQTAAQVEKLAREYWYSVYSSQVPFESEFWIPSLLVEQNGGVYFLDGITGFGDDGTSSVLERLVSRTADRAVFAGTTIDYFEDTEYPFELTLVLENGEWRYLPN